MQRQGPSGLPAMRQLRSDPVLHQSNYFVEGQHVGAHSREVVSSGRSHPAGVRSSRLRRGGSQDRSAASLSRSYHQLGLGSTALESQPPVA